MIMTIVNNHPNQEEFFTNDTLKKVAKKKTFFYGQAYVPNHKHPTVKQGGGGGRQTLRSAWQSPKKS